MSADRPSRLRSELRFLSDECKNLVAGDLADIKWKTFQMIIVTLFGLCPALAACSDEIAQLQELRQRELSSERTASASREDRQKSERAFRVDLCQRLLRGLEILKWPPAVTAFSNPLNDLLEENEVKLNAIEFLVQIVGRSQQRSSSSRREVDAEIAPVDERRRNSRRPTSATSSKIADSQSPAKEIMADSRHMHSMDSSDPLSSPMGRVSLSRAPSRPTPAQSTPSETDGAPPSHLTDYTAMRRTIEVTERN